MTGRQTLFEKIWQAHTILSSDERTLLYVNRHFVTDAAQICFDSLKLDGRRVARPARTLLVADHTAPTRNRGGPIADDEIRSVLAQFRGHAVDHDIGWVDLDHPRHGIVHVIGPELGLTLPGLLIACDDSHTTTHGGLGALALGVGISESTHILATQTLWQPRYRQMRIAIGGKPGAGITAKDVVLAIIGEIGASGAVGHLVEFCGSAVEEMPAEQRMTLCNMAVEAGARAAIVAPDEVTFAYLRGRPMAPEGPDWDAAIAHWRTLRSDPDARFDRHVEIDAAAIGPMVTWGNSVEDVVPAGGRIPDPGEEQDPVRRRQIETTLAYMGLASGTRVADIAVDRVFIGSCTNGRLEDLRAAARIVQGRTARLPTMVVPGSRSVRAQAEAEGLDQVFRAAGFEWLEPGCSMCCTMNGDRLVHGQRSASTTNRNFVGRQGPGTRTHLMSPAMAAAAAVTGRITDFRELIGGDAWIR